MTTPTDFLVKSIRASREARLNNNANPQFPCAICTYDVRHNDKSILCTTCDHWVHIKCNGITVEEYRERQLRNRDNPALIETELWTCLSCELEARAKYTPFLYLDTSQLLTLNSHNSLIFIDSLPDSELTTHAMNVNNLKVNDIEEDEVQNINSSYYT